MKKLFAFFLVLTLAFPCFAANRLKYKIADGEVVTMGAMPDLTAGAGERVVTVDFGIPAESLSHFTFDGEKLVKKSQPVIDKMEAMNRFNIVDFQSALFAALAQFSNINLRFEFGAINTFATNKDFSGLKQYVQFLVSQSIATEGDYGIIASALAAQNITLGDY